MKNVFITGSGRSGTSMLAGAFRLTPAYLGARLHPPRLANPKGFFEDAEVNDINEAVIAEGLIKLAGEADAEEIKAALPHGQLWLASLPGNLPPTEDRRLQKRIAVQTASGPFCFKDPRFSSTLNSWLPYGSDCVVLVIFRDPATTVESILNECRTAPYLRDLALSVEDAMAIWRQGYCRLLELYLVHPNICFVHYDHVLDGTAIPLIEDLVGCELDRSFLAPELRRTNPSLSPDELCTAVYQVLWEIDAEGLGITPTEKRRKAVTELLRHPTMREEASRAGTRQIRGTHRLMSRVMCLRERETEKLGRELQAANQRIEELCRAELERDESSAAADASRRKLLVLGARLRELRQENLRLHQELSFKRANLAQLVNWADTLDRLRSELEQARECSTTALAAVDVKAQELAHLSQELSRLSQQMVDREREAATLRSGLEFLSREKDFILRDLDEARRAKRKVHRSLSWRVTKPLRMLLGKG